MWPIYSFGSLGQKWHVDLRFMVANNFFTIYISFSKFDSSKKVQLL